MVRSMMLLLGRLTRRPMPTATAADCPVVAGGVEAQPSLAARVSRPMSRPQSRGPEPGVQAPSSADFTGVDAAASAQATIATRNLPDISPPTLGLRLHRQLYLSWIERRARDDRP